MTSNNSNTASNNSNIHSNDSNIISNVSNVGKVKIGYTGWFRSSPKRRFTCNLCNLLDASEKFMKVHVQLHSEVYGLECGCLYDKATKTFYPNNCKSNPLETDHAELLDTAGINDEIEIKDTDLECPRCNQTMMLNFSGEDDGEYIIEKEMSIGINCWECNINGTANFKVTSVHVDYEPDEEDNEEDSVMTNS